MDRVGDILLCGMKIATFYRRIGLYGLEVKGHEDLCLLDKADDLNTVFHCIGGGDGSSSVQARIIQDR